MIIKFNQNTVTPYGFSKSSEFVYYGFEKIAGNMVYSKVYTESNPYKRGNISELQNNISFELENGEIINKLTIIPKMKDKLTDLGFIEGDDYNFIQALTWGDGYDGSVDYNTYPIRITLDKDYVLQYLTDYIAIEKAKGYPVIYNTTTVVLYVSQILPEHRPILENNPNTFIEE